MNVLRRSRARHALAGLALVLIVPVVGCETASEPPKVIDTTTPAKAPTAPTAHPVEVTAPAK